MTATTDLLAAQAAFFASGQTLDLGFRREQLRRLGQAIKDHEARLLVAVQADLGKPAVEGYAAEIGPVLAEIRLASKRLGRWARPRRVRTPLFSWPGTSYLTYQPVGRVLIISPWNYPVQLALAPLVAALAAGNTVVLKPSEIAHHTEAALVELIEATFTPEQVAIVTGGPEVATDLLNHPWGHVLFTGSTRVGRLVAEAAGRTLTPVTLELGGKSPAIVDATADLPKAARRLIWAKTFNAGQTCIAPDYLLVEETIKEPFIEELKRALTQFFGSDPRQSPDFGRIINEAHFDRLLGYLEDGRILAGGQSERGARYIAPTLIEPTSFETPIMEEEIFGPLLPIFSFRSQAEILAAIDRNPTPLALYLFTRNRQLEKELLARVRFGGGCINDALLHPVNPHLPFGGVGTSGYGSYHGEFGFRRFSHERAIYRNGFLLDLPFRYQPYTAQKQRLIKWFLR